MGWLKLPVVLVAALAVAACITNISRPDSSPLPLSMHADIIFVGRIVSSEPIHLVDGDVVSDGFVRTFEAVDQPGTRVVAIDVGGCPDGDLGDKALLVFLDKAKRSPERKYYVYACPVIDIATMRQLRGYEVCFRPDPPTYFCSRRP
jgi:hypothetical protein